MGKNVLEEGIAKPVVINSPSPAKVWGNTFLEKRKKQVRTLLIGYSLELSWLVVTGCP